MSLDVLLSRLNKVRRTKPNGWTACCPAHSDKNPSLSIADHSGKILIHCFGGCSVEEVLSAVEMTFADLMPEPQAHFSPKVRRPYTDRELLALIAQEAVTVACIGAAMRKGDTSEMDRLITACGRINSALEMAGV